MNLIEHFESLCVPTSAPELQRLLRRVVTHVDRIAEASLLEPAVAVGLAGELAAGLKALTDEPTQLSLEHRRLIRGAISYFLLTDDADNDVSGANGLDDDREVFNEACRRIGRVDLVLT